MSKPPKKKLKQSSLLEAFKKQDKKPASSESSGPSKINTVNMSEEGMDWSSYSEKESVKKTVDSKDANSLNKDCQKNTGCKEAGKTAKSDKKSEPAIENQRDTNEIDGSSDNDNGKCSPTEATKEKSDVQQEQPTTSHTDDVEESQSTACSSTYEISETIPDSQQSLENTEPEMEDTPGQAIQGTPSVVGEAPSLGKPLNELKTTPKCAFGLPTLQNSPSHTVLFKTPHTGTGCPKPYPARIEDVWDQNHTRMPCSRESLYPIEQSGKKDLAKRWDIIQTALLGNIQSSWDLEEAILAYNSRYTKRWDFDALHTFFSEELENSERNAFFQQTLPKMVELALQLPKICTHPIPLLKKQKLKSITMSQQQAACLLANAFFCTFPRRNTRQKMSEYSNFPEINFNSLYMGTKDARRKKEKLKCIIHYFNRVTKEMPTGTITFRRQLLKNFPDWAKSVAELKDLHITAKGTIEDMGIGMLQVDFANKYVGGGVLGRGCVQEEIRFLLCPEMILSRLFTEMLEKNECLIMIGCERFSNYTGYADSFKWAGNHADTVERDSWGRRYTEVVAIDALVFRSYIEQFYDDLVRRELNKAYCGFLQPGTQEKNLAAVATGNWGCGAFGGDTRLKALIQMMAAAEAKRDMCYFTFNDYGLRDEVYNMHKFIRDKELACSDLWALINQYGNVLQVYPKKNLYEYIYGVYGKDLGDTDEDSRGESEGVQSSGADSPDYAAATP